MVVLMLHLICFSIVQVVCMWIIFFFFFSSRRRHTRFDCDWSSDVCSSDHDYAPAQHVGARDWQTYAPECACQQRHCAVQRQRVARLGHEEPEAGKGDDRDRKSGVEGKRGELGGRRVIKKKKKKEL